MTAVLLDGLLSPGGDRPGVVEVAGRRLSGEELAAAAGVVARRVAGAAAVGVLAAPTLETVVATVGALLAGTPVVPLPADAGPVEIGHILGDSGLELVLAGVGVGVEGWRDRQPPEGVPVVPVDADDRRGGSSPAATPVGATAGAGGGGAALILYTSGTTGAPKGVPVSPAAVAACIDGLAAAWGWGPEDTTVAALPLWHVHGLVLGVLGPLRLGGSVVHPGRPTPEAYAAAVGRVTGSGGGGTGGRAVVFGVPTIWSRLAARPSEARVVGGARLLVSGSASLPAPVARTLAAVAGQVPIERYGMTETLITLSARAEGERRTGWVGLPLDGTEVRVVDDDGRPVPPDGVTLGDLQVRGPTVMAGYLRRPAATAEVLGPDGWLRSGDLACVDDHGWHRIVGRRSTDLINSGGHRIGAGEVEDVLLAHPAVREAAVVGAADEDLGQVVVAWVVADGVDAEALAAHIGDRLAAHKRPRRVHLVDVLPRNAMGKVAKSQLTGGPPGAAGPPGAPLGP